MINQLILGCTALGFGLAYAAAPGAVNTEAVRRGLARGACATLHVELGSLVGDAVWAVLALTGVTLLAHQRRAGGAGDSRRVLPPAYGVARPT